MAADENKTIGFVGGGNMAEALVKGLCREPGAGERITVAEPVEARRADLESRYGISASADNADAASRDIVVLAVKPQVMDAVLEGLAGSVSGQQVVVSIAAGVTIDRLESGLGAGVRVVRVMPNTPCLVGRGASVLCAGSAADDTDLARARDLFAAVGSASTVDSETLMDAVTGLSGSGPAYVYRFAEALIAGGVAAGLDEDLASALVFETIAGAAQMLISTGQSPAALREAVSSPGGTTLAGLGALDERGFAEAVEAAVSAATARSRELGRAGS